ncbi:adenylyltransferase/cytidyltransferase family protein [Candidatus Gottesmanbacteria bacterium]|nr:adenylyltransferase/cytidyltransferase family protein [Candidatus Gottesmanbacteria bacterium]
MERIINVKNLSELSEHFVNDKRKKVMVGGCFDIIHFGHIRFLQAAKKLGDVLIIALESDGNVKRLKGPKRPFHDQEQRASILAELRSVDFVLKLPTMSEHSQYQEMIENISADIIATTEGDVHWDKKKEQAEKIGAKFEIISKIQTYSTSSIAKLLGLD